MLARLGDANPEKGENIAINGSDLPDAGCSALRFDGRRQLGERDAEGVSDRADGAPRRRRLSQLDPGITVERDPGPLRGRFLR